MSLLDALYRHGGLRALDHALGQSLRRLDRSERGSDDGRAGDSVLAAAALASCAIGQGHAAFDPARPQALLDAAVDWPAPQAWLDALGGSRWVGTPGPAEVAPTDVPLVLEAGLLYLRRYREYERRLAAGLQRLAAQSPACSDPAALAPLFAALFPGAAAGAGDQQARAAAQ
ncbi:exodeoxyribonuclease V subunit alpha, partial [Lysobacter sp. D1-1-M9]